MKLPLIIYHAHCMDGSAAALAAWLKFGDEAEYRPASYGDPAPTDDEVRGRDVYVLDFSYPRAELERMAAAVHQYEVKSDGRFATAKCSINRIVVIDHHKSAQVDLAGLPFCWFRMDFSGSVMAWMQFHGKGVDGEGRPSALDVPELFAYVQDRDLWRWELPHSREVSAALAASGALTDFKKLIPIYQGWCAEAMDSGRAEWARGVSEKANLITDGAAILRAERLQVDRIAATAEEVEIRYSPSSPTQEGAVFTIRALATTSAVLQSEVGEALALESARRGRDAVGVVYYRDGATGKWRVSLRSRGAILSGGELIDDETMPGVGVNAPDVSAIAKSFGGGGHAKAAGFECDELPWERAEERCPHGVAISRTRCLKCAEALLGK